MPILQSTQEPAVLVAIDIAKSRHEVLMESPGWRNRKRLVLLNTAVEFRRFADYLPPSGILSVSFLKPPATTIARLPTL
ncbi:MAG TPA: hypothetical protein VKW78_16040 [Terriglobales bacterium]|nr:hypothetical protein [Terriglobales bacterium]